MNDCEEAGGICRGDANQAGMCLDGESRIRSACGVANQACCLARDAIPQRCDWLNGPSCPEGLECVDDPHDLCDPDRGGADCPGICQASNSNVCCEAITATCLACSADQTVEEYCRDHPDTVGCSDLDHEVNECNHLCSEDNVLRECLAEGFTPLMCQRILAELIGLCRAEFCEAE